MPSQTATTMRALVFDGSSVQLQSTTPIPAPEPGEAVIQTTKAAVSSTDMEICRGLGAFTGPLGHEFVGIVESVVGNDPRSLVGKRVVGSINTACGECDMCSSGLGMHCRSRTVLGIHGRAGCLADRFTLPETNLTPVPDDVDDDHAVFANSLASCIQAARQLTIKGKPYITVLGDGPLGLLMVQVMSKLNASVRLVGRFSEKLALCEKWGIKHRHIDDIGRRADQDIVVDCTGSPSGLPVAMTLVRPRGIIVLKTLLGSENLQTENLDLSPVVLNELQIIGSGPGPMSEAVSMLQRREMDVVSLITRRMKLADGPAILKAVAQPGAIKILVDL